MWVKRRSWISLKTILDQVLCTIKIKSLGVLTQNGTKHKDSEWMLLGQFYLSDFVLIIE